MFINLWKLEIGKGPEFCMCSLIHMCDAHGMYMDDMSMILVLGVWCLVFGIWYLDGWVGLCKTLYTWPTRFYVKIVVFRKV